MDTSVSKELKTTNILHAKMALILLKKVFSQHPNVTSALKVTSVKSSQYSLKNAQKVHTTIEKELILLMIQ